MDNLYTRDFNDEEESGLSLNKTLKISFLSLLITITFVAYGIKLYSLQVVEGKNYRERSQKISSQVKTIPANRGEIFDRNASLPLVINTDSFAVDLIPAEIPEGYYDTVSAKLASYLGITKKDVDKKVPSYLRSSYNSIEIRANVPFSTISSIAENLNDLPGVSWRSKPIRNYVETGSISHIIGYVGDITKKLKIPDTNVANTVVKAIIFHLFFTASIISDILITCSSIFYTPFFLKIIFII